MLGTHTVTPGALSQPVKAGKDFGYDAEEGDSATVVIMVVVLFGLVQLDHLHIRHVLRYRTL